MFGSGSLVMLSILVKVPDLLINFARAATLEGVPCMTEKVMDLEALRRIMCQCWAYLGHPLRMWFLVSTMSSSHGHDIGSGEWPGGKNDY